MAVVVDALEERELGDPDEAERPLADGRLAEVEAQLAEHLAGACPLAGDDEHEIAGLGRGRRHDRAPARRRRGTSRPATRARPPGRTRIQTRPAAPSWRARSTSASSRLRVQSPAPGTRIARTARCPEGVELRARDGLREVDELHPKAQVRLVGPEPVESLVPGHRHDLRGPLAGDRERRLDDGLAHEAEHLVLTHEGRLDVELGELELAIGPQVLVPHAAGDLVVAVDPADHEELLGDLGALRQHVERAALQPGRDRELARALGRRRPEQRRLDLDEALALHGPSQRAVHLRPQPQVALHPLGAQIEVAIAQPDRLVGLGAGVEGERRRLGRRQGPRPRSRRARPRRSAVPGSPCPRAGDARCR